VEHREKRKCDQRVFIVSNERDLLNVSVTRLDGVLNSLGDFSGSVSSVFARVLIQVGLTEIATIIVIERIANTIGSPGNRGKSRNGMEQSKSGRRG
jgi:hypothetical protein